MKFKTLIVALTLLFSLVFMNSNNLHAQKERNQIDEQYKWDLTHLYTTEEDWQKAKQELTDEIPTIESFKGNLTKSSDQLLACLDFDSEWSKKASCLPFLQR